MAFFSVFTYGELHTPPANMLTLFPSEFVGKIEEQKRETMGLTEGSECNTMLEAPHRALLFQFVSKPMPHQKGERQNKGRRERRKERRARIADKGPTMKPKLHQAPPPF